MVNDTPAASDDRSNGTWRDVASPQAQADLDELLSAALGAAMEHLEKNGEFYPFAMSVDGEPTIDSAGEPTAASNQAVAPDVDIVFADPAALGEQPEPEAVLAELRRVLAVRAENENRTVAQRATAIVLYVVVPEFGDAVRVDLEHAEGVQLMVLAPVKGKGKSRKRTFEYGDLRLLPGQRHIW
ncbi:MULTISPECIES: hypothetical protein [Dermacoccus]|uniref:hypothetical protein n=1 Tax=Dermacoccus TaxID=57495 RepID=UPI0001E64413|nr:MULTISPECIES: hypothetical protein [unclassified Dermacoccus]EFP57327.1 hypothetical protein HMPREF0321_1743 [Dermacoccus sp. Ellin185]